MGDGADRVDDLWQMSDGSSALAASLDDVIVEDELLAYAQRSAARAGAEWYAAEFQRRDEEERRQIRTDEDRPAAQDVPPGITAPEWARMSTAARRLYAVDGPSR